MESVCSLTGRTWSYGQFVFSLSAESYSWTADTIESRENLDTAHLSAVIATKQAMICEDCLFEQQ